MFPSDILEFVMYEWHYDKWFEHKFKAGANHYYLNNFMEMCTFVCNVNIRIWDKYPNVACKLCNKHTIELLNLNDILKILFHLLLASEKYFKMM